MSQTLRRELRLKFIKILNKTYNSQVKTYEIGDIADLLADTALSVSGISKQEAPQSLEWLIRGGASDEEIAKLLEKEKRTKEATDKFEHEFAFAPLPWDKDAKWMRFKKFVVSEYSKDPGGFRYFTSKRLNEGQFSKLPSNAKIYQDPDLLIAIWPSLKAQPIEAKGEHLL